MKEEFLEAKVFTLKKHPLVLDDYGEHLNINEFDFKKPSKFSKEQIRIFELIHNTFASLIETRIAIITRDILEISLILTEQKSFLEYVNSIKDQSLLGVIKSNVFSADIILQLNNQVLLTLIDKILGGDGKAEFKRDFTEIEKNLAAEVLNIFVEALQESWVAAEKMELSLKEIEDNAQFIRSIPPNEMCLVFNFKIEISEKRNFFTLCIPFIAVKPVLDNLNKRSLYEKDTTFFSQNKSEKLSDCLDSVNIGISVILGSADLTFNEINQLEVGDIIRLENKVSDLIDMVVEENRLFRVKPGKISNKIAVEIVEKL
jgi:flagellar motor switch protein FliM